MAREPTRLEQLIRRVKTVKKTEIKDLEEIEFLALSIDERKRKQNKETD